MLSDYNSRKKGKTTNCFLSGDLRNSDATNQIKLKIIVRWINCINDPNFVILSYIHTFSLEALVKSLLTKRQDDFQVLILSSGNG